MVELLSLDRRNTYLFTSRYLLQNESFSLRERPRGFHTSSMIVSFIIHSRKHVTQINNRSLYTIQTPTTQSPDTTIHQTPDMHRISSTKAHPFLHKYSLHHVLATLGAGKPGPGNLLGHILERLGEALLAEGELADGPDLGILSTVKVSTIPPLLYAIHQ